MGHLRTQLLGESTGSSRAKPSQAVEIAQAACLSKAEFLQNHLRCFPSIPDLSWCTDETLSSRPLRRHFAPLAISLRRASVCPPSPSSHHLVTSPLRHLTIHHVNRIHRNTPLHLSPPNLLHGSRSRPKWGISVLPFDAPILRSSTLHPLFVLLPSRTFSTRTR